MGHDSDPGIVSLTMQKLFAQLEGLEADNVIEVQASYFEIYNENILDLLRPGMLLTFVTTRVVCKH